MQRERWKANVGNNMGQLKPWCSVLDSASWRIRMWFVMSQGHAVSRWLSLAFPWIGSRVNTSTGLCSASNGVERNVHRMLASRVSPHGVLRRGVVGGRLKHWLVVCLQPRWSESAKIGNRAQCSGMHVSSASTISAMTVLHLCRLKRNFRS